MQVLFDEMKKSPKNLHASKFILDWRHVLAWMIFIGYEVSYMKAATGSIGSLWNYFFHYINNAMLFYLHCLILLPLAFSRKNLIVPRLLGLLVLEIGFYIVFSYFFDLLLDKAGIVLQASGFKFDLNFCVIIFYRAVYLNIFSTAYYFIVKSFKDQKLAAQAEQERLDALLATEKMENAFLKAQINPHFLFNTLNFIYREIKDVLPKVGDAMTSLSNIMRYSLQSEHESGEGDLMQEIEEVENLIKLHRIRLKDEVNLEFDYKKNVRGVRVIPLVLLTLVENVFKHGDLSLQAPKARIFIHYQHGELIIETHNLKKPASSSSHNIGINNIIKRLNNHYKDAYSFETDLDEDNMFHVSLIIRLEEREEINNS